MDENQTKQEAQALADHIATNPASVTSAFNNSPVGKTLQFFGVKPAEARPEEVLTHMAGSYNGLYKNADALATSIDVNAGDLKKTAEIYRDAACTRALPLLEERLESVRDQSDAAQTKDQLNAATLEAGRLKEAAQLFEQNCGPEETYRARRSTGVAAPTAR